MPGQISGVLPKTCGDSQSRLKRARRAQSYGSTLLIVVKRVWVSYEIVALLTLSKTMII
jgi:hypothetical protein